MARYFILAAGGTGGHMMPAASLSDALKVDGHRVGLITDPRGDAFDKLMQDTDRLVLDTSNHARGGLWGKLRGLLSVLAGAWAVRKKFKQQRPDVVIGFGGYPSLPSLLAAYSLGIPIIVHEQNAVLGRVNRLMATRAHTVALGIAPTQLLPHQARAENIGNPVRQSILDLASVAYSVPMGRGDIRIMVVGGSQGARILSDNVPQAIGLLPAELRERLCLVHQARREDVQEVSEQYENIGVRADVQSFFDDMAGLLSRTHLVISRAGASTLAEIAVMGRPAILVPLKIAANDHQTANALALQKAGGAWMFDEADFQPENIARLIAQLLADDLALMRDASEHIRATAIADATQRLRGLVVSVADNMRSEERRS